MIQELWHGNIIPQEDSRTNSKEMKELLGYMSRHHEDLEKSFTDEQKEVGKYGRLHLEYLKAHRKGRYTNLLSEGTLNQWLYEIDVEAKTMVESIIPRLAAERGIDEDLKSRDMLRWVSEMNNIKASAEEIVLREMVYV